MSDGTQTTIQEHLEAIKSINADVYALEKDNGVRDRDSLSLAIGDQLSAIESMLSQPMKGAEEWIKEIRSHGKVFCSQEEVDASVAEDIRAIQNDTIASVLKVSKSTGLESSPASASGTPSVNEHAEPAEPQERGDIDLRKLNYDTFMEVAKRIYPVSLDGIEEIKDIIHAALLKAAGRKE